MISCLVPLFQAINCMQDVRIEKSVKKKVIFIGGPVSYMFVRDLVLKVGFSRPFSGGQIFCQRFFSFEGLFANYF